MGQAKLILFLLFVPAMLAEMLTGNAPPARFFSPLWLLIFVLLYGCGCLLVREAQVHWNLQWGVLYLAVAYGIVEEGLMTKAFFILAFLVNPFFLIVPNEMAKNDVPAMTAILVELAMIVLVLLFG